MDVLAVPNVCGADLMRTSNFAMKPVRLSVFAAARPIARVPAGAEPAEPAHAGGFPEIRDQGRPGAAARPRLRGRVSQYADPLLGLAGPLDAAERDLLRSAKILQFYGGDEAAALRDIVFSWWEENYMGRL